MWEKAMKSQQKSVANQFCDAAEKRSRQQRKAVENKPAYRIQRKRK